jgi:hypothetical protein
MAVAEKTWPTQQEGRVVLDPINDALDLLDGLTSRYRRMLNLDGMGILAEGAPKPTLAEVGILSEIVERLKTHSDDLTDPIEHLKEVRGWASMEVVGDA